MAYCRNDGTYEVYMYKGFDDRFHFHLSKKANGIPALINFSVDTTKEALHRLKRLRTQGYKIPDYAFKMLEKEISEGKSK